MKWRLFTTVSAVSLLLCVAALGWWLRGYSRGDVLGIPSEHYQLRAYFNRGVILCDWDDISPDPLPWESFDSRAEPMTADSFLHNAFNRRGDYWIDAGGFALGRFSSGTLPVTDWIAAVPFWFVTLMLALCPMWWSILNLRRQRQRAGVCASCGYDLRASGIRCSECGALNPIGERNQDGTVTTAHA